MPNLERGVQVRGIQLQTYCLNKFLSMIIESQFRVVIMDHMINAGIIDEDQYGSTKGRSTVSQLISQQDQILKIWKMVTMQR